MATLLTTSNILVNTDQRRGLSTVGMLTSCRSASMACGTGLLALASRWLRRPPPADEDAWIRQAGAKLTDVYSLQERLFEGELEHGSSLDGKSIADCQIGEAFGLSILAVMHHGGQTVLAPAADEPLRARDRMVIVGRSERVEQLAALGVKVAPLTWQADLSSEKVELVEVVVAPRSRVVGRTLKDIGFGQKFGVHVAALWRGGRSYRTDVGEMPLAFGDALLVHGPRDKLRVLQAEPISYACQSGACAAPPKRPDGGVTGAVLVVTLANWLPSPGGLRGLSMVVTGCLAWTRPTAVEWKTVFHRGHAAARTGSHETGRLVLTPLLAALGTTRADGRATCCAGADAVHLRPATAVIVTPIASARRTS
jgi:K+/H+ antiporter YhaU regulatory subunit KhtT